MKNFLKFGLRIPHILLPKNANLSEWCVIACDQYTQDKNYWQKTLSNTNGKPSTYNLILPEIYLNESDKQERINKIHASMNNYLKNYLNDKSENVFAPELENFIYIERQTNFGRTRKGLICELDLESYDWHPEARALVRATEATIPERIPPRKAIRQNAPLESPHIMLLANDRDNVLFGTAEKLAKTGSSSSDVSVSPVYDGDLMMNGGHITGWKIENCESANSEIYSALQKLFDEGTDGEGNVFLFAVGDGNHSLATAKSVWDDYKKTIAKSDWENCRVRYALVEIVNLFDEGLTFEPIHRVLLGKDCSIDKNMFDNILKKFAENLSGTTTDVATTGAGTLSKSALSKCDSFEALEKKVAASSSSFGFVATLNGHTSYTLLETKINGLAVARFQPALDKIISEMKKAEKSFASVEIDFIHGAEEVSRLGDEENTVSMLLPPIAKSSFFDTITKSGVLPRKSFSMGEADEKRFYLECRKLF